MGGETLSPAVAVWYKTRKPREAFVLQNKEEHHLPSNRDMMVRGAWPTSPKKFSGACPLNARRDGRRGHFWQQWGDRTLNKHSYRNERPSHKGRESGLCSVYYDTIRIQYL